MRPRASVGAARAPSAAKIRPIWRRIRTSALWGAALLGAVLLAFAGAACAQSAPSPTATTTENTPVTLTESGTNLYGLTAPADGVATYAGGVSIDANVPGSVTYTPASGFVGTDSFTYEYCRLAFSGRGSCTSRTLTVTVEPAAPTADDGSIATGYDTAGSTTLAGAGVITGYAILAQPAHGVVTLNGSSVTYSPTPGFYGQDSFTFDATGPGGASGPATISVTVGDPPPPTASNGSLATAFNAAASMALPAAGVISGYAILASPAHGAVSLSGAVVTYTPAAGFYGADSFTFQASGPGGPSGPGVITVTVGDPPAPTLSNGAITTPFNTAGSTALSGSGVITRYALVAGAAHGAAVVSDGTAVYTPNAGYFGSDSFTVEAIGPGGASAAATIVVTVGLPPAPSASDGAITTPFDTAGSTALSGSGVITSYALVAGPSHGAAAISGATAVYTPNAGYSGTDSFTVHAVGPGGISAAATIAVTVGLPPAPTASNGAIATPFDTAGSTALTASGVVTRYALVTGPVHGAAVISGGTAVYTPNAGYFGSDSFTFQAIGPGGTSAAATIAVTVGLPPAPTASNGAIATAYDTAGSTALSGSGAITSYALVAGPSHGAAVISGATALYTPNAGYYGPDSFTVHAVGPGGISAAATIAVTVGDPPAPTASNGAITTAYDTAAAITLPSAGVVTGYAIAAGPAHGAVSLSGAVAAYTPAAGYFGPDSFSFTAVGPGGVSQTATISVTVLPPAPPVANSASLTCPYQTVCTITLTSSGVATAYSTGSPATNGVCTISGDILTYTPAWGAVGSDSCGFVAKGPGGSSAPATIYITNEPPPGGAVGPSAPGPGASQALCAAGQSASIPGLPGPPTGTVYDPNWCDEQVLTIAEQAAQLQNQLSQIGSLQSQLVAERRMLQRLGADPASGPVTAIGGALAAILQQATGIGFNAQAAGANFGAAYPATATTAGFNGAQLTAALQTWQANTAQALATAVAVQNTVAQAGPTTAGAVRAAVSQSNAAPGATAAHQATNQVIAVISTQLAQLQDILVTEAQAYAAVEAARQQAAAAAAAMATQTGAQVQSGLSTAPGVDDTSHM